MKLMILLFGLAIAGIGGFMLWQPRSLLDFMRRHVGSRYLQELAIGVRLVLGIVLIGYADHSRFPLLLSILGGLSIAAAVVIAVLPGRKFEQLVRWAIERFEGYIRPASVVVTAFGLFLIAAVA